MKHRLTATLLSALFALLICSCQFQTAENSPEKLQGNTTEEHSEIKPQYANAQETQTTDATYNNNEILDNISDSSNDEIARETDDDYFDPTVEHGSSPYVEHYARALETRRKICSEMAEKHWEDITCYEGIPYEFKLYFDDLYLESKKENEGEYFYTITGSSNGLWKDVPLYLIIIIYFDENNTDGIILKKTYATYDIEQDSWGVTHGMYNEEDEAIRDPYDEDIWHYEYGYPSPYRPVE